MTQEHEILLTLKAIQGHKKRPRDLTMVTFSRIRGYLWRHGWVSRSVVGGAYGVNERGERLLGRLEKIEVKGEVV